MSNIKFRYFLLPVLFLLPVIVQADGLVPCGGPGEPVCQFCHIVTLIDNVVDWLIAILFLVLAIMLIISGLQLVVSGGDPQAKTSAKKRIFNGIIGFMIVLAGWLLVDMGLKALANNDFENYGAWNAIQCVSQK